jgi:DNA-binding transcriptional LysR family regulator
MNMDWNLTHAFLTTAEAGSLSAAARILGLTQPTLSRRVAALEEDLGVTLFERVGKSLILTEAGERLLVHARAMGFAAETFKLAAMDRAQTLEGRVRISAVDAYCAYILPEILEPIRLAAPKLSIDLISTNTRSDLQRREADIAIRHVRPETDELIGRLALETRSGFYASRSWVDRHGMPASPADLSPSSLIGFEDREASAAFFSGLGFPVAPQDLLITSENSSVQWELVKKGWGVSLMLHEVAVRTENVVELFTGYAPSRVPVWLLSHRELHSSRRIRLVFDLLAEKIGQLGS